MEGFMNMEFRTAFPVKCGMSLRCGERILTMGSCFADRFAQKLKDSGFRVEQNPFGTLYNPMSVVKNLERLWWRNQFHEEDLFEYEGLYGSLAHHTSFSGNDPEQVLENIQQRFQQASEALHAADCLILTFGTSWVYAFAETGKIVANCHKLPDYLFTRRRLEVNEIVEYYREFLGAVLEEKPDLRILMTVSPIRHFKDGVHENTLSKSVLHLAIDELELEFSQVHYFPAYELLMDDLRDYRYYADDMLHPSEQAVRYVWEKFSEALFDKETLELASQLEQIHKAMEHRPFHPEDEAYLRFAQKNLAAVELLQSRFPSMDFRVERDFFDRAAHPLIVPKPFRTASED